MLPPDPVIERVTKQIAAARAALTTTNTEDRQMDRLTEIRNFTADLNRGDRAHNRLSAIAERNQGVFKAYGGLAVPSVADEGRVAKAAPGSFGYHREDCESYCALVYPDGQMRGAEYAAWEALPAAPVMDVTKRQPDTMGNRAVAVLEAETDVLVTKRDDCSREAAQVELLKLDRGRALYALSVHPLANLPADEFIKRETLRLAHESDDLTIGAIRKRNDLLRLAASLPPVA